MTLKGIEPILKIKPEELRELCKENNLLFKQSSEQIDLANTCGTVSVDNKNNISYHAFLIVNGKINSEDEDCIGEFANANLQIYMAVAQRTLPNLKNLEYKYEMHSLDAGLLKDWSQNKTYIQTWLSIKEWEQFGYPPDKNFKRLARERVVDLIEKLNLFTKNNTEIYQFAIDKFKSNPMHYYFNNKTFEPALPDRIKKEFNQS